ncbi:hypothetical protein FNI11_21480 [Salmonella enterica subsp. salamae]|nr:hypothetical protein [Salmonella enterica subsp. salamae]ECJ2283369.1 hypothetical protein [Salmonella enterica subsp. salamae]
MNTRLLRARPISHLHITYPDSVGEALSLNGQTMKLPELHWPWVAYFLVGCIWLGSIAHSPPLCLLFPENNVRSDSGRADSSSFLMLFYGNKNGPHIAHTQP